jgi:hypothetical protein
MMYMTLMPDHFSCWLAKSKRESPPLIEYSIEHEVIQSMEALTKVLKVMKNLMLCLDA